VILAICLPVGLAVEDETGKIVGIIITIIICFIIGAFIWYKKFSKGVAGIYENKKSLALA